MASRVDLANLALTKLGSAKRITSLTENSVAAGAINAVYDLMRLAELRAHYWAFALKRTAIPASATLPSWGYTLAFPLPADFVRLVQVNQFYLVPGLLDYNDADASDWAIESGSILCNYAAPLRIRYVWNVTDEGTFDPLFNVSFASRLAYECCEQITNSNSKKAALADDYKAAIKEAVKASAIEKPPAVIGDDSWMMARL